MQGTRIYSERFQDFTPGTYGAVDGLWICCPPAGAIGVLRTHQITEHEDGTIPVAPSILTPAVPNEVRWHGYLERGIWREV